MTPFIYPHQFRAIKNELNKLLSVVYFVGDFRVYQAAKDSAVQSVYEQFVHLTSEQRSLFEGLTEIKGKSELNEFMERLRPFVVPFAVPAPDQLKRLFKKEKKLALPNFSDVDTEMLTYVGWRDISTNSMYLVYPLFGEWVGIKGRYTAGDSSKHNVCSICRTGHKGDEIGMFVAKTRSTVYKSIGNYICLDSVSCNERVMSCDWIEEFVGNVMHGGR